MRQRARTLRLFSILILNTALAHGGSYVGTAVCSETDDCAPAIPTSSPLPPDPAALEVTPFAITHPPGYDGTGGVIQLRVCLAKGDEAFAGALQRAIATWNALSPTIDNCEGIGCRVWEEPGIAPGVADAESVLLHELGHCAFGLEHVERNWDAQATPDGIWEDTRFTRSWGVANPPNGIQLGSMTDVPGSRFNIQIAAGGGAVNSVAWYRRADNNPFMIDGTVIELNTFSRSIGNLPVGSDWMANANRRVAEDLGLVPTQATMYGRFDFGSVQRRLTADDVNMVKMGMTGVDLQAGTADDYTVELVASCVDPIAIFVDLTTTASPLAFGECKLGVDYSFPQNPNLARHFTVQALPDAFGILMLRLNENLTWDTGQSCDLIQGVSCVFADGFETGDTTAWTQTVP